MRTGALMLVAAMGVTGVSRAQSPVVVTLPTASGRVGEAATLVVTASDLSGVTRSFDLQFSYDPSIVSVTSVSLGSGLTTSGIWNPAFDLANPGRVVAQGAQGIAIPGVGNELLSMEVSYLAEGVSSLSWLGAEFDGTSIAATAVDGSITVTGDTTTVALPPPAPGEVFTAAVEDGVLAIRDGANNLLQGQPVEGSSRILLILGTPDDDSLRVAVGTLDQFTNMVYQDRGGDDAVTLFTNGESYGSQSVVMSDVDLAKAAAPRKKKWQGQYDPPPSKGGSKVATVTALGVLIDHAASVYDVVPVLTSVSLTNSSTTTEVQIGPGQDVEGVETNRFAILDQQFSFGNKNRMAFSGTGLADVVDVDIDNLDLLARFDYEDSGGQDRIRLTSSITYSGQTVTVSEVGSSKTGEILAGPKKWQGQYDPPPSKQGAAGEILIVADHAADIEDVVPILGALAINIQAAPDSVSILNGLVIGQAQTTRVSMDDLGFDFGNKPSVTLGWDNAPANYSQSNSAGAAGLLEFTVAGGTGSDTFSIQGAPADVVHTVLGGGGEDQFTYLPGNYSFVLDGQEPVQTSIGDRLIADLENVREDELNNVDGSGYWAFLDADTLRFQGMESVERVNDPGLIRMPLPGNVHVVQLLITSSGSETVSIAGTTGSGVYVTEREGRIQRWVRPQGVPNQLVVTDLRLLSDGRILLTAAGFAGAYMSSDAGSTWVAVNFGNEVVTTAHAVSESSVDGLIYLSVDNGRILRSDDAGVTWSFRGPLPAGAAHTPSTLETHPANSLEVYAGTPGAGVYRSTDGGDSWAKVDGAGLPESGNVYVFDLAFDPELSGTLWAGTASGLFRSDDLGNSFTEAVDGFDTLFEIRSIAFGPVDPAPNATGPMYVGTWGGGVYVSQVNREAGVFWSPFALRGELVGTVASGESGDLLGVGTSTGVHFVDPSTVLATAPDAIQPPRGPDISIYPNPLSGPGTIEIDVPTGAGVFVELFDVLGRRVQTLSKGRGTAGRWRIALDPGRLSPGLYIVRATVGSHVAVSPVLVGR